MAELKNNEKWISTNDASVILNRAVKTIKDNCRKGLFSYKVTKINNKTEYLIAYNSLPEFAQRKYCGIENMQILQYRNAPDWAKFQADKYKYILGKCENLKGVKLKEFVNDWNNNHTAEEDKVSYSNIIKMRRRFFRDGVNGLLAKYGHTNNKIIIDDELFDYFKNLFLVQGAPSLRSCWDSTLGYAIRTSGVDKSQFPSCKTFLRRLENKVSKQSIYLARYGQAAWNRKYGNYIERDYSNIICGKVWVSDHAQIDVACITDDGNVVFPWVTAWRDYKSGKWLGWILQTGSPNSDLIFQSFYYAARSYGLPQDVIIDNGKDYRCKDFAGGRNFKVLTNEPKTTAMLSEINVKVHFALPYNAQTKPIERDFLKIKELLSKHCVGYRGGNIVERPEKLADEIKQGKILNFNVFKTIFDDFIINVLNKRPSEGKNLNGKSPDALFNEEFIEKILPCQDALKLFCMRTSRDFTIGRNGIKDKELGITYWADWMCNNTQLKVYLRRDVLNYKEAWAFRSDDGRFVGKVTAVKAVAALYANEVSSEEFKIAMANKKRNLKIAKEYIKQTREISIEEQCENYKAAYASVEKPCKPKVMTMANTKMDKVIAQAKEMDAFGKNDLSMFIDENKPQKEETLYLFETDKILEEELKGVANGY